MTIKVDEHGLTVQASRPALSQTLTIGGSSVQSNPFSTGPTDTYSGSMSNYGSPVNQPNNTNHIRLVATSDCWVAFGPSPMTAVAGTSPAIFLPASVPEYFWVYPGEVVAVVQNAAGGSLNIGEMVA